MTGCVSIILAAGNSSRLGRPKQLLKVGNETLLRRTARLATETGCESNLVVLGAFYEQLQPELEGLDTNIIVNPDWHQGMGTSIACAANVLLRMTPMPQSVLFLVCDQPALNAKLLRTLLAESASSGKGIAAASYAGVTGVPVVLSAKYFAELSTLSGEQGARRILSRYPEDIAHVDFAEGSFDIDTEADAARLAVS